MKCLRDIRVNLALLGIVVGIVSVFVVCTYKIASVMIDIAIAFAVIDGDAIVLIHCGFGWLLDKYDNYTRKYSQFNTNCGQLR